MIHTIWPNFSWTKDIVLYFIHLSFSQWRKQFLVWVVVFRCHKGRKWKIWQPQVAVRPREDVNVHFQPECGRKTATSTKNCFCHWENDKCNGVHYFFWFCRIYDLYGRSVGAGGARSARGAGGLDVIKHFLDVLQHFFCCSKTFLGLS